MASPYLEARIKPSGDICIIDVGARKDGDAIMDLVERSYGINPYELHAASYLDVPVQLPAVLTARGLSAVSFMKASAGVIDQVRVPAMLPETIVNMHITAKPQDISGLSLSWRARRSLLSCQKV